MPAGTSRRRKPYTVRPGTPAGMLPSSAGVVRYQSAPPKVPSPVTSSLPASMAGSTWSLLGSTCAVYSSPAGTGSGSEGVASGGG